MPSHLNNMENLLSKIRKELKRQVDERTLTNSQHFFKEKIKLYGVTTPKVRKISKDFFKISESKSKAEIFDLCDSMWRSGYLEESLIASHWSYFIHKKYEPRDFAIFERWVNNYINNWASCDTFCNHTIGTFIEMYPGYLSNLKVFAKSENRWMRRASAVSLIVPARKGKFLKDILEIADILLLDEDDLVQKAYGWLLKVTSKLNEQAVYNYVMKNKAIMARTALRYSIEKMPKDLKAMAMDK